jgi:DNA mismatch endonuclease, patch repair protein
MRGIRQSGTEPELALRRLLWRAGIRFRCSNRDLPGTPDIANRAGKWVIFVHGCFWHGHRGCRAATVPKRNRRFWLEKIEDNKRRDMRKARALRKLGYAVATVWECKIKALRNKPEARLTDSFLATLLPRLRRREG